MTCVACSLMNDFRSHGPQKSLRFFLTVGFEALHPRFRYPRAPMRSRTGILSLEISTGKSNSPGGFFFWNHLNPTRPRANPPFAGFENFGTIRILDILQVFQVFEVVGVVLKKFKSQTIHAQEGNVGPPQVVRVVVTRSVDGVVRAKDLNT